MLEEWLIGTDEQQVDTALMLMANMPWKVTLTHPQFVESTLNAAHARGSDSLAKVAGALLSVATVYGDQSRTLGEPPPRQVRLRDDGSARAQDFAPGSSTRQFYENVVERAEARLREAKLQDEEYPEEHGA